MAAPVISDGKPLLRRSELAGLLPAIADDPCVCCEEQEPYEACTGCNEATEPRGPIIAQVLNIRNPANPQNPECFPYKCTAANGVYVLDKQPNKGAWQCGSTGSGLGCVWEVSTNIEICSNGWTFSGVRVIIGHCTNLVGTNVVAFLKWSNAIGEQQSSVIAEGYIQFTQDEGPYSCSTFPVDCFYTGGFSDLCAVSTVEPILKLSW